MSFVAASVVQYSVPLNSNPALTAIADKRLQQGWLPGDTLRGTHTDTQPAPVPEDTHVGALLSGVNDALYGQILIEPSRIDVGTVVSTKTRNITVWNGFFADKPYTQFNAVDAAGINTQATVSPPYTFRPLEEQTFVVDITTQGPPAINAELQFTIGGDVYTVVIVGERLLLLPVEPNWREPITEQLEWLTDVITAYDGSEQRSRSRLAARRAFEYSWIVDGDASAHTLNLLQGWQNRVFSMPVWMDKTRLAVAVSPGTTTLQVDTTDRSFEVGGFMALFVDKDNYEQMEIATVSTGQLTLTKPLAQAWPVNTPVYPVVIGRLPGQLPMKRHTSTIVAGRMPFQVDPARSWSYLPEAPAPDTYAGHEIVTRAPNWINPISYTSGYDYDVVDYGIGQYQQMMTPDYPTLQHQFSWLLQDRADVRAFREFLARRQGRWQALWVPSFTDDFEIQAVMPQGITQMTLRQNRYDLVGADSVANHIVVRTHDGGFYPRKVAAIAKSGGDLIMGVDSAFPIELNTTNVRSIHLVRLARLAADTAIIEWLTNGMARTQVTFTTVNQ